ncbi:phosphatidate cytidylyltransferase [Mucilaginibacter conchicola]|uniref:Phosphatidate cytidylyltransferase n=1 Tax=Mucilaginibacter conchicola TaxID=2303333 RepID=A0A372NU31_9SPHI|nr:phosphatidate cytidylyltransferase [Mucilaginibacter conchicola]RFZ92612.1 phosphatidate cytidylyltransferase [Mucilaginibacter conchicola]
MKTRAITGFFFLIVMIGSLLLGPQVFLGFYLVLTLLCLHEFYGLIIKSGITVNRSAGFVNAVAIFVLFGLMNMEDQPVYHKLLFLLTLTLASVFVQELYKISPTPFTNIGFTFLGLIFTVMPFTFFHALAYAQGVYNFHFPLAFLIMLWSNDTGAYLTGRAFGRTKLFERHSPKKTWEGFIGGVAIAAGVAYIISLYYPELDWKQWVSIAIIIGVIGTTGDLIESMFKRSINVKDSGGLLPGHGGVLDRFDGLLFAAPIVYTYLHFVLNA